MNIINFFRKRKFEIAMFIMIIGIIIYNSYLYTNNNILLPLYPSKTVSSYEYWEYVRTDALGIIILFASPILIMFMCCYNFYQKLYSRIYQYFLLRFKNNTFFKKNIIYCYLKSIFFIPMISLIIFIIGNFMLPNNFLISDGNIIGCTFNSFCNNPILFIFLSVINNILYSIICCNTFLFFQTKFKELYKIIVSSFLFIFISNYTLYFILLILFKVTSISNFDLVASSIELYQGYSSDINIIITFLYLLIYSILSTIFIFYKYKKYHEVVDIYE